MQAYILTSSILIILSGLGALASAKSPANAFTGAVLTGLGAWGMFCWING